MTASIISAKQAKDSNVKDLLKQLNSSEKGLTSDEVKTRIQEYGPNAIEEKEESLLLKYLKNFWGPIPWLIEFAAILSLIVQHWEDFFIISSLLLFNSFISFFEEYNAANALKVLQSKLALKATVLRDGKWSEVLAANLVPGDVIRVRMGFVVPADAKLLSGKYLQVDQSALTGESLPVELSENDVVYSGSIIKQGEANAIVFATGVHTYFGKTTELLLDKSQKSEFQKAIEKIGNFLIIFDLFLIAIIFPVALLNNISLIDIVQFSLVLTVSAVPVALPAVLSVTMVTGAAVLTKKGAIVKKLVAIEEMAGVDILCSDKTGTLTLNKLSISTVDVYDNVADSEVLLAAALTTNSVTPDAIDQSILDTVKQRDEVNSRFSQTKIIEFSPFNPDSKRSEATVELDGKKFKVSKGAPQVIAELVKTESAQKWVIKEVEDLALKGYRALAVSQTDQNGNWILLGMLALFDPPRPDTKETVRLTNQMGLDVKMITGDHKAIAVQLAKEIDLGTHIISLNPDEKEKDLRLVNFKQVNGFAQVLPEHKYDIVDILQDEHHLVAMTGDGVNDAPALKKATVGIAVSNATDAARSAADIVLTEPGLSTIVDGIRESRKIFGRMENYSIYRIVETIRILVFITLSILAYKFFPITTIMVVLLALLNDIPIMAISVDNVEESKKPIRWHINNILSEATFIGLVGVVITFIAFYIGLNVFHLDPGSTLQTFVYLKLSVAGHFTVFVARTKKHFWSIKPSKYLLMAVILTQSIATLFSVYGIFLPAIGWGMALFIWAFAFVEFLIEDTLKVQFLKMRASFEDGH